ncbi:MAG: hypothetical protein QW478_04125 [Candidatus Micrarchaeaceae archaeon]
MSSSYKYPLSKTILGRGEKFNEEVYEFLLEYNVDRHSDKSFWDNTILIEGLDGLGKTTFAKWLSQKMGWQYIYFQKRETPQETLSSWVPHKYHSVIFDRSAFSTVCYHGLGWRELDRVKTGLQMNKWMGIIFLPNSERDRVRISLDPSFQGDLSKVKQVEECFQEISDHWSGYFVVVRTDYKAEDRVIPLNTLISSFKAFPSF